MNNIELKYLEKALLPSVNLMLCELGLYLPRKENTSYGQLYTRISVKDKLLKIGFSAHKNYKEKEESNYDFNLIGKRSGTLREVKILKATLQELGYQPIDNDNSYKYSKRLIKYLKILGWPTENLD